MIPAKKFWIEISEKNKKKSGNQIESVEDDVDESMSEDQILNDFKEKLLNSIAKMTLRNLKLFTRFINKNGCRVHRKRCTDQ